MWCDRLAITSSSRRAPAQTCPAEPGTEDSRNYAEYSAIVLMSHFLWTLRPLLSSPTPHTRVLLSVSRDGQETSLSDEAEIWEMQDSYGVSSYLSNHGIWLSSRRVQSDISMFVYDLF